MKIEDYVSHDLLNVDQMVDKINNGVHFAFGRMGDGEMDAVLGVKGQNCDGHTYFYDMAVELATITQWWTEEQPENYYLGLHVSRRIGDATVKWLKEHCQDVMFARNCEFHVALVHDKLGPFYDALKDKEVIIVGPKRLQQQTIVNVENFVTIPETNAWNEADRIVKDILKLDLKDRIVLFCAGPPAAIFIDRVWQSQSLLDDNGDRYNPPDCTLIDFGSTLDPSIGVNSRSFHKKLKK